MAKRARADVVEAEADDEKKRSSSCKPAKALAKYQLEMEVFVRTKLGQNVVFGMKNCDKHLRVSYHSEDENQKENKKIIDLFQDLLPFPVILHGWKGVISVYLYRPKDIYRDDDWEFIKPWNGGYPKNDKWFYSYHTSGDGTVYFITELIRVSQELFYLSRFGGKFTSYALEAYEGLQKKEKENHTKA